MLFDDALNIFLKYVPEDEIDSVLYRWYRVVDEVGGTDNIGERSDYYDLLRPVLVENGVIDDDEDV
jgi:hypothetical protein